MFKELYQRYIPDVEATMREVVESMDAAPQVFKTTVKYPLGWTNADGTLYEKQTGKRIRPMLLLACVTAAGGDWKTALPAAAAVEILHNFSLVHDDIQDMSDTRHNRPTVWKVWGQPLAINTGDAMFALSYRAVQSLATNGVPAGATLAVLNVYTETILELTRGQFLDMRFETRDDVSVEEYVSMIRGKTAALLAGSANMAALIAGQPVEVAQNYSDFGLNLGLAFQVRDDILGIWGDAEELGKSTATDILSRKKSVPILYGLQRSDEMRELYTKTTDFTETDVARVLQILKMTDAREATLNLENQYYTASVDGLDMAQPTDTGRAELMQLVDGLFKRSH